MNTYGHHISIWADTTPGATFKPLQGDMDVDTAIVGGGITGLTAAFILKKAGKRVAVLERGGIASGATGNSSAHLSTLIDLSYGAIMNVAGRYSTVLVGQSMREAINTIENCIRELHIDCGFSRVDGYYYAENDKGIKKVEQQYEAARSIDLPVAVAETVPLPYPVKKGFKIKNQALFHPIAYCNGLARAIRGNGSEIFTDSAVTEFSDGTPCIIKTGNGTVRCRELFCATHTPLGVNPLQAQLSVQRSYVIAATLASKNVGSLFWNSATPYEYIRPYLMPDGTETLIVGGKDHGTGRPDPRKSLSALERFTRDRFSIKDIVYHWSTQYYDPSDSIPFIGRSPFTSHIYVATGFSGDGLVFGTVSGMVVADMILNRSNPYTTVFKPSRLTLKSIPEFIGINLDNAKKFVTDRLKQGKSLDDLKPGEATYQQHGLNPAALYRDEAGTVHSSSAVCPHLKCIVHWNNVEKSWDCPCHGSRYTIDGANIEGPALSPLPKEEEKK